MNNLCDKIGIFVSGLCLVHCISLPFLSILIPFVNETIHIYLFLIIVSIGFYSFYFGYKKHYKLKPLTLFIIGSIFLSMEIFFHYEILSVIGSLVIIIAHIINTHHCQKCNHSH